MCNDLKIGNVYKNFKVLNIFELKDYHSKAINLIHIRTGFQILHLLRYINLCNLLLCMK